MTLFTLPLCAQAEADAAPSVTVEVPPASPAGQGAVVDESTAKSSSWRAWVFASGAITAAAIGVTLVAINAGHHSH